MRHRKRGRKLGRNHSHRRALLRNLASSLLLTLDQDRDEGKAKVPGRIITTPAKAKEVQPFVERLITLARNSLLHERESEQWGTQSQRNSSEWEQWRNSDQWQRWAQIRAPYVAARQRALSLLRDKQAVEILFEEVAPRFEGRPGGYTRIIHLAGRRLGDAGPTAILELVGEDEELAVARPSPVVSPAESHDELSTAQEESATREGTPEHAEPGSETRAEESSGEDTAGKDEAAKPTSPEA